MGDSSVIKALDEAENQLKFVKGKEIGIHTSGSADPYYTSWNDGEYAISMAWHLVVSARISLQERGQEDEQLIRELVCTLNEVLNEIDARGNFSFNEDAPVYKVIAKVQSRLGGEV